MPEKRTFLDLEYASVSPRHHLDLYLPSEDRGPFPVIVFVHGGGYVSGSKADIVPGIREAATERGYAVASIGYRLMDEGSFPAQMHDVKAAIRWIRANAGEYGLDPDRMAGWGFSAGGHLVALAGTSAGVEALEGSLGVTGTATDLQAVVDWAGPTDFFEMEKHTREQRRRGRSLYAQELDYLSDEISSDPDLVHAANPATHADPSDPSFLIQHGAADDTVPVSQSRALAKKLRSRIGEDKVLLLVESDAGHVDDRILGQGNIDRTLDWLDAVLPSR